LIGGVDFSRLKLEGFDFSFQNSVSAVIGAGIDLSSPRLNDRIFFTIEATYLKQFHQGYHEIISSSQTIRTDYLFNMTFIRMPVGFRINLFEDDNTPYIKAGIVQYFKVKSSIEVVEENESKGKVTTSSARHDYLGKNQTGYWIGLGFSKAIWGTKKGFIECRYERASGFIGQGLINPISSTQTISALVGLRF
jgi:hypothetical protein